jgi:hypothetical protein
MTTKWQDLAATSHYQTATAIREVLKDGKVADAAQGLEELIEALSKSERRALESHLIRLMQHIIKWRVQPERRSRSWAATIRNARRAIVRIQRDTPSLTRRVIEVMWDEILVEAMDEAEGDMNTAVPPLTLNWHEVFEDEYTIEE